MEEYLVPTRNAEAELIERRSRFLGRIFRAETEAEALTYLKQTREKNWDADHNVYAYIIGGGATRFSDDGEPGGTAGMPVLEVLRREGLSDVLCVVTRYFGGILLGAGGLVRAYTKAAKLAVDEAGVSRRRLWARVEIPCPYGLFETVKTEVSAEGGLLLETEFGAAVTLLAAFPEEETQRFLLRLQDLSAGRVTGAVLGREYRAFPVER
ncbi:MAG: YigZ family protein [Oscillospiraceae bacterium]|nr:YigZ family protein [Oscillospiraceae bacterium]